MNKYKKIVFGFIAIIIIVLIVVFSVSNNKNQSKKIRVGLLTGITGQYASMGESIKDSVILALGKDPNIDLFIEDSKFEAKTGLSAYQKLTQIDKIDYLIIGDSLTFPVVMPLINKSNLVTFNLFESTNYKDDSIFQIMPFSYSLFKDLGTIAGTRYQKVALVYANADLFMKNADYFKQGIDPSKIVYESKLLSGADYKTEVTKLLSKNPEATTVILSQEDGIRFLTALKEQKHNKNIKVICDANMELSIGQYIKAVGKDLLEGCISTMLPVSNSPQFITDFKNQFNSEPQFGADYAYDASNIIEKISKLDDQQKINYLKNLSYDGVSGKIIFDKNGTRLGASETHILKDGKFEKLNI
jgi:ABC-type branched-subunit amino acid transport system substrate-binding protein